MVIAPKAGFARTLFATVALGAMTVSGTLSMGTPPAIAAQGPASVADLAEGLLDAVVNISTSQTVKGDGEGDGAVPMPQVPEGSPSRNISRTSSATMAARRVTNRAKSSRWVPVSSSMPRRGSSSQTIT